MTTIVANPEGMASDTRVTGGPMFNTTKMRRIGDSLYGGAGDLSQILKMFLWFENPDQAPVWKAPPEFTILQVSPRGIFVWESEMIAIPIDTPFYAIGSGSEYAMGALAYGANLDKAIEIASMFDPGTSGSVHYEPLTPKRRRR
jgi:hypothetical protein